MKTTIKPKKAAPKRTAKKRAHPHLNNNGYEALLNSAIGRKIRKNIGGNDIALGLLAMGLAGGATYLLLNSKKQKELSMIDTIKHKAEEYAHDAYDTAADYVDGFKCRAEDILEENPSKSLLAAGTIGSLLGASAVYLMNQQKDNGSHDFGHKIMDILTSFNKEDSNGWMDTVKNLVESVNGKKGKGSNLSQALEVGMNGLSILDSLMKKNRR